MLVSETQNLKTMNNPFEQLQKTTGRPSAANCQHADRQRPGMVER